MLSIQCFNPKHQVSECFTLRLEALWARIRRYKSLGWQIVAPFHWWHAGVQASVNLSTLPVVGDVSEFRQPLEYLGGMPMAIIH